MVVTAKRPVARKAAGTKQTEHLDLGSLSETEVIEAIREKVTAIRDYTPKIGILGETGVGKSSLCNALFGDEVADVGAVEACTRDLQEITIGGDADGRGGMVLIDMPGVGETPELNKAYLKQYKKLHPKLDLVIWVMDAGTRAFERAIAAYRDIFEPDLERCPVVFVLSQADRVNPVRQWNTERNEPGPDQATYLEQRRLYVADVFDVSPRRICPVSAHERYNLVTLVNAIVEVLPREKKFSFVREARSENVSTEAAQEAQKGIFETLKEWAGTAYDTIKEHAATVAVAAISKVGKTVITKAASWFRSLF